MNSAGYLKWINSERKKVTFHCNKPYKSILIIRIELLHFDYPILYVTSTWGLIYYLFCNFWWYTVYTNTKKITYSGNVESSPLRIFSSPIFYTRIFVKIILGHLKSAFQDQFFIHVIFSTLHARIFPYW